MKGILVVNIPKNCAGCKFRFDICSAVDWEERPSWCPIKPLPTDAIPIEFIKDRIAENESYGCYGYAKGLQSAIDEWEKEIEK